jgi:acyl dehydratase
MEDTQSRVFADIPPLVRGMSWTAMKAGLSFRTPARTVTETDLINFVTLAGFTEPLFLDARVPLDAGYQGRLLPGALVYCLGEGLVIQSHAFHGTGVAFMHMVLDVRGPTYVGDTLAVAVEITESRASSRPGHGVVTSRNIIFNQHGVGTVQYDAVRLIRESSQDRPDPA